MDSPTRRKLLAFCRGVITQAVTSRDLPEFVSSDPQLNARSGAFVTLHKSGELRGCIGHIISDGPLWKTVRDAAVSAALHDPRFTPITAQELTKIDIEISVLSPLEEVENLGDIEVGRHGLLLRQGAKSGLLLPQVPVEQKWNKEEYLNHLCLKAGLPPGAHKDPDAKLFRFTAEVFQENDPV